MGGKEWVEERRKSEISKVIMAPSVPFDWGRLSTVRVVLPNEANRPAPHRHFFGMCGAAKA
jgi:hypothetical protein